jgi:hypothetical protein
MRVETTSNSIICLSVNNETELDNIFNKLSNLPQLQNFLMEPDLMMNLHLFAYLVNSDVERNYHIFLWGKKKPVFLLVSTSYL